jgi:NADH-quinone oxidoreductase subunit J
MVEQILFAIFGILAVGSAISVIALKNPVHSALALVLTFFSLAGLFILLGAHFVAAVQVIVYAGAIMVLFLFVIMLLNLGAIQARRQVSAAKVFAVILGVILAAEVAYIGFHVYNQTAVAPRTQRQALEGYITPEQLKKLEALEADHQIDRARTNQVYAPKVATHKNDVNALTESEAEELMKKIQQGEMGKTASIGTMLFSKFLLPFEVTSFILLAALIGVIALVKRENPRIEAAQNAE